MILRSSMLLDTYLWCVTHPGQKAAIVAREGTVVMSFRPTGDITPDCCAKTRTETAQYCLKQASDKWAARVARAELRAEALKARVKRLEEDKRRMKQCRRVK